MMQYAPRIATSARRTTACPRASSSPRRSSETRAATSPAPDRFTLVDRSAEPLLDEATALVVAVVNAAPFGGGVLAKGPAAVRDYACGQAHPEVMRRIEDMDATCRRHEVPLAAAAPRELWLD
jgi:hypothetical protein